MDVTENKVVLGSLNEDMKFPAISSCLVLVLVLSDPPGLVGAHFTRPAGSGGQISPRMMKTMVSLHTCNRRIDRCFLIGAMRYWTSTDLVPVFELTCDDECEPFPGQMVDTSDVSCVDVTFAKDGTLSIVQVTPVNAVAKANQPTSVIPRYTPRWRDLSVPPPMKSLIDS